MQALLRYIYRQYFAKCSTEHVTEERWYHHQDMLLPCLFSTRLNVPAEYQACFTCLGLVESMKHSTLAVTSFFSCIFSETTMCSVTLRPVLKKEKATNVLWFVPRKALCRKPRCLQQLFCNADHLCAKIPHGPDVATVKFSSTTTFFLVQTSGFNIGLKHTLSPK